MVFSTSQRWQTFPRKIYRPDPSTGPRLQHGEAGPRPARLRILRRLGAAIRQVPGDREHMFVVVSLPQLWMNGI